MSVLGTILLNLSVAVTLQSTEAMLVMLPYNAKPSRMQTRMHKAWTDCGIINFLQQALSPSRIHSAVIVMVLIAVDYEANPEIVNLEPGAATH